MSCYKNSILTLERMVTSSVAASIALAVAADAASVAAPCIAPFARRGSQGQDIHHNPSSCLDSYRMAGRSLDGLQGNLSEVGQGTEVGRGAG